jgi:hypothetical protein
MASREPAPTNRYNRISIGDVGFIRWGRFHLLFSAGCQLGLGERRLGIDVPSTFEELHIGDSDFRDPLDPGPLNTDTVRNVNVGGNALASVKLCVQFFELSFHF